MSTSTDGEIWYGVLLPEGFEFPWDEEENDLETWWREDVSGWDKSLPWGNMGRDDPRIGPYFAEQRAFDAEHPCPIELVNTCSADYPMYGVAVNGTVQTANRGSPEIIDVAKFSAPMDETAFWDFINKYIFPNWGEYDGDKPVKAKWYLSSYWG